VSIKRRGQVRFISSEWLDVPNADNLKRIARGAC